MRMGIGFPFESHGNGNSFWAANGNNVTGMALAHRSVLHNNMQ